MQKVIVIVGPTASGKTALGIEVAKKINGAAKRSTDSQSQSQLNQASGALKSRTSRRPTGAMAGTAEVKSMLAGRSFRAKAGPSGAGIISADSRQVFAGLNSGTAKPKEAWRNEPHDILTPDTVTKRSTDSQSQSQLNQRPGALKPRTEGQEDSTSESWPSSTGVPHYLLNIKMPTESYSLAEWQHDAFAVADRVLEEGKTPIVVGGTMLYADSFVYNYQLPNVAPNPALREELAGIPAEELYRRLLEEDPAAKTFIEPGNKRRIIRALEVIEATGEPFSKQRQRQQPRYDITMIGLFPSPPPAGGPGEGGGEVNIRDKEFDWSKLKEYITQRAEMMFKEGLIDETKKLVATYGADLPLLQTLNYRQALALMNGTMTESEALASIIQDTNRYARRQMSWWKNNQDITWLDNAEIALKYCLSA